MKKLVISVFSIIVMVSLTVLTGCNTEKSNSNNNSNSDDNQKDSITLKFNGLVPKSHYLYKYGDKVFINEVEKLSNGKMNIEYYPDAELGKAEDMIDLMNSGTVDIGSASPPYLSGKMPSSNVFQLPHVIPDAKIGTKVVWDLTSDKNSIIHQNDYEKNNLIPLYAAALPLYEVVTVKNKPVKSVDDLKGLKLRSSGGLQNQIIESIGATPVEMSRTEDYQALQRGTINGGLFNIASVIPNKVNEVTNNYTTNANLSSFVASVEISEQSWNKLSDEQQDILKKAGEATVDSLADAMEKVTKDSKEKLDDQGFSSYKFTKDELQELDKATQPVKEKWIKKMKKQNVDGQKILNNINDKVKSYE